VEIGGVEVEEGGGDGGPGEAREGDRVLLDTLAQLLALGEDQVDPVEDQDGHDHRGQGQGRAGLQAAEPKHFRGSRRWIDDSPRHRGRPGPRARIAGTMSGPSLEERQDRMIERMKEIRRRRKRKEKARKARKRAAVAAAKKPAAKR